MNSDMILYLLSQLCEADLINQLNQQQLQQNWSEMERLLQNKLSLNQQKTPIKFQSKVIATRDLQFALIQRNNGSVRHTLAQLEKLEENMMFVINKSQYNNPIRTQLRLIATFLSQVKETLKKIALLEMKQIIVTLISKISTEIVDIQLNDLLQHIKIDYRFFLGYEVLEGEELSTFSQIVYEKNCIPVVPRETRIESIIYHRKVNANKKCNDFIACKINETRLEMLKEGFHNWKKRFIKNPIENESLEIICTLWYKNLEEIKQILLKKTCKQEQIEGQLDLWNYQKIKSLF